VVVGHLLDSLTQDVAQIPSVLSGQPCDERPAEAVRVPGDAVVADVFDAGDAGAVEEDRGVGDGRNEVLVVSARISLTGRHCYPHAGSPS